MRRIGYVVIVLAFFGWSAFSSALFSQTDTCQSPLGQGRAQQLLFELVAALKSGQSEICVDETAGEVLISNRAVQALKMLDPTFDGTFAVVAADHDITIKNLKFRLADDLALNGKPFFSVSGSGAGKVFLQDISIHAQKTGANAKSANCIFISAPDTVLEGVEVDRCAEGIVVAANDAKIRAVSKIHDNKIGIRIKSGARGTDIERSMIYGNGDGDPGAPFNKSAVWIEDAVPEIGGNGFIEVVDKNKFSNQLPATVGLKTYKGIINIPPAYAGDGKVELYFTSSSDLPSCAQGTCGFFESGMPIVLKKEDFANRKLFEVQIPAYRFTSDLVMIFTSGESGSYGLSPVINFSGSQGIVTFIDVPFEIPTQGGQLSGGDIPSPAQASQVYDETTDISNQMTENQISESGPQNELGKAAGCSLNH